MMRACFVALFLVLGGFGCSDPVDGDAGSDDDAGARDAGPDSDGGPMSDSGSDAGPRVDAGEPDAGPVTFLDPDDPGAGDVRFDVHTGMERHGISPWIYGHNSPRFAVGVTMHRLGGNRWSAYNWETNHSNAGSDYCHQNDTFLSGSDTPGEAMRPAIVDARAAGAASIVTVPMTGYVSADAMGGSGPPGCSGDVQNSGSGFLDTRFVRSVAAKGAAFADPPDTSDDRVYQDEMVSWVESTFARGSGPPIFYSLDNEPDLWSDTHARIHPAPVGYEELRGRTVEYAAAIKAVAPDTTIFGPVSYGWAGYLNLQSAPDAAGRDFLDYFLAEMASAETSAGRRLLDVLDLHWYPEARGGGQRITVDDGSTDVAAARVQAPRSLWDPTYVEDSWIRDTTGGEGVRLLPRLHDKIDTHYPGTRIAFTEYYYGGGEHISGGVAQADVLGVFADHDVFAAALWHLGGTDDRFIEGAFRMYRDVDGSGAGFGDVSVSSATNDAASSSVHASVDGESVVIVAINRTSATLDAAIAITHTAPLTGGRVYVLDAGSSDPVDAGSVSVTALNAFHLSLPAMSVSTLILSP